MNTRVAAGLTVTVIVLAACAPTTPRSAEPSAQGEPAARGATGQTLMIIARGEPPSLAMRAFQSAGGNSNSYTVFNSTLDNVDERGAPHAELAEALPQLNTDTWRVLPDGLMETTYRLKPNLTWHDGTPLRAEDFAFAWRVYATPALGTSTTPPIGEMAEASAPDDRTLLIRWRRPYAGAALLRAQSQAEGFQALPRHILEQPYLQGDYDAFANHPFWTREYVGLGPYRLDRWEPGAAIEGVAYDGFVLGRPKIPRVRLVFMADANSAVASLLSGEAHVALDYMVMYDQAATLLQQWGPTNGGTVLFSPLLYRLGVIQFRPELMATPAILDVRFRRALAHGMDKVAINDALLGGQAVVTDGLLSPRSDYYAAIEPAITKYPYDPRRAQQLLDEMGLQRGADGLYLGPDGRPFSFEVMVLQNPSQESENAIIVDGYQRAGVNAIGRVLPVAMFADGQARASYTGMLTTGAPGFEPDLSRFTAARISRPETRWQGLNYGAWVNESYDRLWDAYNTTLDRTEQIQVMAQMERILSQEVPQVPMFYTPLVTPYVAALVGPVLRTSRVADNMGRIHEWHWRS
jgi:peptide/nickel transport system substrate-binding protein